jgi:SAM-dependent methyltransferase
MSEREDVATAWDREYAAGRYTGDPPVPFVHDIITSATRAGVLHRSGVDIGCGNGRNYVALVDGGLDVIGLDVSETAIRQLAARLPVVRRVSSTATSPRSPPGRRTGPSWACRSSSTATERHAMRTCWPHRSWWRRGA